MFKHYDKLDVSVNYVMNLEGSTIKKIAIGTVIVIGTGIAIFVIHSQVEYYKNDIRFRKENFDKLLIENAKLKAKIEETVFIEEYAQHNEALVNELEKKNKKLELTDLAQSIAIDQLTYEKKVETIRGNILVIYFYKLQHHFYELASVKEKIQNLMDKSDAENLALKREISNINFELKDKLIENVNLKVKLSDETSAHYYALKDSIDEKMFVTDDERAKLNKVFIKRKTTFDERVKAEDFLKELEEKN